MVDLLINLSLRLQLATFAEQKHLVGRVVVGTAVKLDAAMPVVTIRSSK